MIIDRIYSITLHAEVHIIVMKQSKFKNVNGVLPYASTYLCTLIYTRFIHNHFGKYFYFYS